MEQFIYHIVTVESWNKQRENNFYTHHSLSSEGFIHASTATQLDATIQRYYAKETEVVVLTIDTNKLLAELKYELAPSVNQLFPHIFGTINMDAVVAVDIRAVD